jgi:hypothetical protein
MNPASRKKTFFQTIAAFFSQLTAFALLVALAPVCASAQQALGTVKGDSFQVYRESSAQSEAVSTLARGAVVRINWSVTNGEGSWCGVSSIDPPAKLGFVRCDGLERQSKAASAPSQGLPEIQESHAGSPSPTRAQKAWALAASALLTEFNHEQHDSLAGVSVTELHKSCTRTTMQKWWDIRSREDLLRSLEWLDGGGHRQEFSAIGERASRLTPEETKQILPHLNAESGHRLLITQRYYPQLGQQSVIGFDYARYISLCRWGYTAGYLSEDEAWPRILYAARILQQNFSSWRELGENYLIGREYWSLHQTQVDGGAMRATYNRLLSNSNSPWNRIPWTLNLQ